MKFIILTRRRGNTIVSPAEVPGIKVIPFRSKFFLIGQRVSRPAKNQRGHGTLRRRLRRKNERFPRVSRDALSSEELVESSNSTKKLEHLCSQFNRIPLRSPRTPVLASDLYPARDPYTCTYTCWCVRTRGDNPEKGSDSPPFVIRSATSLVAKTITAPNKNPFPKFLEGQPFGKYLRAVFH